MDHNEKIHLLELTMREYFSTGDGWHHRRLNDEDYFDRIEIETVPRFKESGLSGDEWRFGVRVRLYRKEAPIAERSFGSMDYATAWLNWGLKTINESHDITRPYDYLYCSNYGCPELFDVAFRIKKLYHWDGTLSEHQPTERWRYWRGFCERHSHRGDSDMEDMDANYETLWGERPSERVPQAPDNPGPIGPPVDPNYSK